METRMVVMKPRGVIVEPREVVLEPGLATGPEKRHTGLAAATQVRTPKWKHRLGNALGNPLRFFGFIPLTKRQTALHKWQRLLQMKHHTDGTHLWSAVHTLRQLARQRQRAQGHTWKTRSGWGRAWTLRPQMHRTCKVKKSMNQGSCNEMEPPSASANCATRDRYFSNFRSTHAKPNRPTAARCLVILCT